MKRVIECPYEATYALFKGKWTICLLNQIAEQPRGFNEMLRLNPDISPKMLTQKLKHFEENGIVMRKVLDSRPPSTEYSLAALGLELMPLMRAVEDWGRRYLAELSEDAAA